MPSAQRRRLTTVGLAATVTVSLLAYPAAAAPNNNSPAKLTKAVTVDGVLAHLRALQSIATANGGTRASGTEGYDASVDYVAGKLEAAGYDVTIQPFQFPFFRELGTPSFTQVSPTPTTYTPATDFATMTFSGSGDLTAPTQAVDVMITPGATANSSTSGCEDSDFAGFVAGRIALLQRGTCTFGAKALNAQEAGAAGVIIFNEGQAGRTAALAGTLGGLGITIPVVGVSFAVGVDLASPAGTVVRLAVRTESETRTTYNVLAQTQDGRTDNVVMAGAHLDSVVPGPGINDNGSGSAALLEVALQMAKVKPNNAVRFAWWGAEELGLLGSTHYVNSLSQAERDDIALYLNFDMVGSPNYFIGIYDGDNSDNVGAGAGPAGSAQIEDVFEAYFDARGLPHEGTDFSGRSDYGPFIAQGIPAGGLFTGAEEIKTPAQQARYGGTAGAPFDACYHQACDTIANVNTTALDWNSDAIAYAVITFAFDTSAVNGLRSPGKSHGSGKSEDAQDKHAPVAA